MAERLCFQVITKAHAYLPSSMEARPRSHRSPICTGILKPFPEEHQTLILVWMSCKGLAEAASLLICFRWLRAAIQQSQSKHLEVLQSRRQHNLTHTRPARRRHQTSCPSSTCSGPAVLWVCDQGCIGFMKCHLCPMQNKKGVRHFFEGRPLLFCLGRMQVALQCAPLTSIPPAGLEEMVVDAIIFPSSPRPIAKGGLLPGNLHYYSPGAHGEVDLAASC